MTSTQTAVYQTSQIRDCEEMAKSLLGLSEDELMERAGSRAFSTLIKLHPDLRNIAVFCGSGNNGGDGYVLARLAKESGYSVVINHYKSPENSSPVARRAAEKALAMGVPCQSLDELIDPDVELIVDALLGIGLKSKVQGAIATAISQINDSKLPVLALDVPSGLDSDNGRVMGVCVKATATVTFIGHKLGLMTNDGPDYRGQLLCHNLELENCLAQIKPSAFILDNQLSKKLLMPRQKNSYKNQFGNLLIIGGDYGMPGSVYMAARAALRVGAGLVRIATRPEHALQGFSLLPEAMSYGIKTAKDLSPLLEDATVCVLGPGLGLGEWSQQLFSETLASQLPIIIDASALHLLAKNPQQDDNWILSPHPGEAATLLNCSTADIQKDRYQALLRLHELYGGNIVLKGAGTLLITEKSEIYLCREGNPGMATAGMGDVLSGVVGGLVAQGLNLAEATQLAVWLHANAGDLASAQSGERGLLATDLMPFLHQLVNDRVSL